MLTDDIVARVIETIPEPIGDDAAAWVSDLCFAIEAEVRAQDETLISDLSCALDALVQWTMAEEEHFDGSMPDADILDDVNAAIAAARARLKGKP